MVLRRYGHTIICPTRECLINELKNLKLLDVLIHCAGKAHSIKNSVKEEQAFFDSNVELTKRLTSIISENAIRVNTFIFISTTILKRLKDLRKNTKNFQKNYGKVMNMTQWHKK
jgi:UDP-glucose 4-epimerase